MGSQISTLGKSLLSSICSWYNFEKVLEGINEFLEFVLKERKDLPLISFISTLESK